MILHKKFLHKQGIKGSKLSSFLFRSISVLSISFLFILNSAISQVSTLTKGVDLSNALNGENLVYTLDYGCSSLTTDCIGAILVDTIPDEVTFQSATVAIVSGNGGTQVINPIYDPVHRTVTWDFTTIMPEAGLPDGASGSVDIIVQIVPGVFPNSVSIVNEAALISTNAGTATDDATTDVPPGMPEWNISKSNETGEIFHDQDIDYQLQLCSGSPTGNLNLLPGTVINDTLPEGAVFVSADNGGIHDGGTPGIITWTLTDTLFVDEPCEVMNIVVQYPSTHPANQTGTDTQIQKTNKAEFNGTAIGGTPVSGTDEVDDPLLPPVFMAGITKEVGTENGATPDQTTNKFTLAASNQSTTSVDSFTFADTIPPQADITIIQIEPTMMIDLPVNIRVQLNNSGTWINFQTGISSMTGGSFDVTTIPGWIPGTSYVSVVEWNYGTVPPDFSASVEMIFTPSYPTANNGTATALDIIYSNTGNISFVRPLDDMTFTSQASEEFCVTKSASARVEPEKSVDINYVTPPPGGATTGNPYFLGARVKYTLHVENDGGGDADDDPEITADSSFAIVNNPIISDLLPPQMDYEAASWTITNNTSGETWDNTGGNPVFETVADFNGSGNTLLRWTFTGDLEIGEDFDICFNAEIKDTVAVGQTVVNEFAMSSTTDFYCGSGACEPDYLAAELNNFYGTIADPNVLLPGITEMCVQADSFMVIDTVSAPTPIKSIASSGPYAPAESPAVEAGISTDTVAYRLGICNDLEGNFNLPDPVLVDLLPNQLEFVPGSLVEVSNTTGVTFAANPNGATNPTFEVIDDFNGTGRQLMRWNFDGDFPLGTCVEYEFKANILLGAGGDVLNTGYASTDMRDVLCANGSVLDTMDMDNDGLTETDGDLLCEASAPVLFSLPIVTALGSQKSVKGVNDPAYLFSEGGTLGVGSTEPDSAVDWQIRIFNAGNTVLTDAVVYDILPHIDDTGVQLTNTERETAWRPTLRLPVTSSNPNIKIFYSQSDDPCRPEINPENGGGSCVNDWTQTPPADLTLVRALKFDLEDEDLEPAEEYTFDIFMKAPDSLGIIDQNAQPGIAWNSIARNANEVPAQEPNKVGIKIKGYDMALRKTLASGQSEFVIPGDDVDFRIEVFNQSSDTVQNITITDYIPTGMTLNDSDWTSTGPNSAEIIIAGPIPPGISGDIEITLQVSATAVTGDIFDNFAEITSFEDTDGTERADWDSSNNNNDSDDAGGQINSDADDEIDGNGQGTIGDGVALTDEDDHDGVRVFLCPGFTASAPDQYVCTNDLPALNNVVVPTTAAAGDVIQFVSFSTQQTGANMYTGGTLLETVNPSSGNVTLAEANIPMTLGDHYIYAILSPAPSDPDCRPFDEIFIQINPPVVANISSAVGVCPGFSTTISATPTGGTGTYSYNWDNGLSSNPSHTVSPSSTTTYNVTVTDSGGNCTSVESVTVTVHPQPVANAGADQEVCPGGMANLLATTTSGTPAFAYEWSNGAMTDAQTPTMTSTTTFNVTVTDNFGCEDDDSVIVRVFDISASSPDPVICLNDSTNINTTINEGTAASYLWSNGATTASIRVSPPSSQDFKVTVTDDMGCQDSATVSITVNPLPMTEAGADVEICYGFSTTLTASGGNTYVWSNGATTASTTVSPLSITKYYVTATDGNLCQNIDSVTVMVNASPIGSVTALGETCFENNDGSATAGVTFLTTAPYSFEWSNGEMTSGITNLEAGTYTVTITDGKGCRDTIVSIVSQPDTLMPNLIQNQDTCQMSLGSAISAVSGGSPIYNYEWSTGATTPSISNLPIGTYILTVTDANMCEVIDSIEVIEIDTCYTDLALKKVLNTPLPIKAGEEVQFKITVYNQGTIDANQIEIKDYFPSELALVDAAWDLESATVAVDTVAYIPPKDSVEIFITFHIHSSFQGGAIPLVNNAEITSAIGEVDQDSPLSNTNDGSTNELATDNDVNDETPWTPGSADNPVDEDDYDPVQFSVECKTPICTPVQLKINEKE